jgi:diacylglycerol kinase (ATP)
VAASTSCKHNNFSDKQFYNPTAMRSKESAEILVVYNPQAGGANGVQLRALMQAHFPGRKFEFCETSATEGMVSRLKPWITGGVQLVIAAGGDGTISDVATALAHTSIPLGILPIGTGNILARELRLPLDLDGAAKLLAGEFSVRMLDVIRTDGRAYLLAVGVGMATIAMKEATPERKQKFGKWAYWLPYVQNFFNPPARTYDVEVDGKAMQIPASELLAVNVGIISFRAIRWGPEVVPDDGIMNLCYLQARTGIDYLWLVINFVSGRYLRNRRINSIPAKKNIRILAPAGIGVQADGDWIGVTPVEMRLDPAALKVVVPVGK